MTALFPEIPPALTASLRQQEETSRQPERPVAAGFLLAVATMQIIAAFVRLVQGSSGRCGRTIYQIAFFLTIFHDVFAGLIVPSSLVWVAAELLVRARSPDALLAAVVGTLWYGPERVQSALQNVWHIRLRYDVLCAALAPYHRAAVSTGPDGRVLPKDDPLPVRRRLRAGPWWSTEEMALAEWWHGRLVQSGAEVQLVDSQLRAVARKGIAIAFSGKGDEDVVRAWCAAIVADQARYALSALEEVDEDEDYMFVFEGFEGLEIRRAIEEHGKGWDQWSVVQLRKLGTVARGIKHKGLGYVRKGKWFG